ncbi:sigma-70 family RNA polymerase sigma factor [Brunnivagina elsteri]|uniref:Group 3/4 sigma-70 RNA polymerase sigma factor n=1 Tax=Brunnivagina elsteri CCALA 953 TaxID=987040 RepID=A0A2A2TJ82_9CYAN|nr:sigma-70 family RNA polymerase sigma factor [Calothrix elsteri]PAX53469.1 group 3/4 sigma-70 RNA polymerase sigma factor [Calothrix elsteri CCALA 953]
MRSRQGIIELFTTFLELDADRAIGWAIDARLRRSMVNCQASLPQPETSENFWISYWYKQWHNSVQNPAQSLGKQHLVSYLQEVCYWSAQKVAQKAAQGNSSGQYSLSDCFQMAIMRVDKVLKGFKPDVGFNLKNYGSVVFSCELKEILRSQNEIEICTNWRLLRKLSHKRLVESLQNAGYGADMIPSYVLVWRCYIELYAPEQPTGTRRLPKPDEATWKAISQLYNLERHTQLSVSGKESNSETVEKWLVTCAKAVRSYLYPSMTSINAATNSDNAGELQDILPQLQQESILTEMIAVEEKNERQLQRQQISDFIVTAIKELDNEAQKIIQLYYSQELTQQQIAKELEMKQYTVSRRLSKTKDTLLIKLATWCQESMHISLNSSVLDYVSTILEEWLQNHYSSNSMPLGENS